MSADQRYLEEQHLEGDRRIVVQRLSRGRARIGDLSSAGHVYYEYQTMTQALAAWFAWNTSRSEYPDGWQRWYY